MLQVADSGPAAGLVEHALDDFSPPNGEHLPLEQAAERTRAFVSSAPDGGMH
ncbi:hypothetical protein [Kitasatospora aureofaciens]|uniref:Uncharacterized protein n=1 Tax=Kitasatospora aureofaciens TaxID=1894 RepID=A0A8H9HZ56_KITAU|nr:hypothetical protein [Kitasatospora aureofaciens]GGU88102.1 hypothetical protein GCM10010502_45910 [Kitasatospora aureofaciens]